jgi:ankyrin repeat protein
MARFILLSHFDTPPGNISREPEEKLIRMETSAFFEFVRLIVSSDLVEVSRRLCVSPELATTAMKVGATRQDSTDYFITEICHYVYGGDTALHIAAAAFSRPMAELLVSHRADCRAKNRRGAEPIHYASDANQPEQKGQGDVIEYLISVGADPDAVDKSGVTPLHRAVRTRSREAVRALLDGGAKLRQPNKSGSTPLHLAVQATGRGGAGSDAARQQQVGIIKLLLARGAKLTDQDSQGKTVEQAATSEWVRTLLTDMSEGNQE